MPSYSKTTKKLPYSIFFLIPFLVLYEIGIWKNIGGGNINGADYLVRYFFNFILSFLNIKISYRTLGIIVGVLLVLFVVYLVYRRIKIKFSFLFLMLLESLALAFGLAILVQLTLTWQLPHFFTFKPNPSVIQQINLLGLDNIWAKVVACLGAGIFEEFVFRVVLVGLLVKIFGAKMSYGYNNSALIKVVLLSSLIFAVMHAATVSTLWGYLSIFITSIFLTLIYLYRGYGVAAMAHAYYDFFLMIGLIS